MGRAGASCGPPLALAGLLIGLALWPGVDAPSSNVSPTHPVPPPDRAGAVAGSMPGSMPLAALVPIALPPPPATPPPNPQTLEPRSSGSTPTRPGATATAVGRPALSAPAPRSIAPALSRPALPPPPKPMPAAPSSPSSPSSLAPPMVETSSADRALGDRLLSAVDAGQGSGLVLNWPASPADRRRLSAHLVRCAGLRVALLAEGRLWRQIEPRGRPWTPDPVMLSPVIRQADRAADGLAGRIRSHHGIAGGALVAVVARGFDARIWGGLARLVGGRALGGEDVRASYAVVDGRVHLTDIVVGGRRVAGRIDLGTIGRCG